MKNEEHPPRAQKVIEGARDLSLGISVVVAILLGVGIGYWMRESFGYDWLFWLGLFWGVGGAVLNVYKAYKRQLKAFEELKKDPRYQYYDTDVSDH